MLLLVFFFFYLIIKLLKFFKVFKFGREYIAWIILYNLLLFPHSPPYILYVLKELGKYIFQLFNKNIVLCFMYI